MNAETIAHALGGFSRKSGGGFMACCPAHDDRSPSLGIDDSDSGLLIKCFAGCSQEAVVTALKSRNLWPETGYAVDRKPVKKEVWTPICPIPAEAPSAPTQHYQHGEPTAIYQYRDMIVHRYEFPDSRKQFSPLTYCRSESGRTEWRFQALPDKRPLYGLELLTKEVKFAVVVEGEKACEAARRILGGKIQVITWSGGSNAVNKTDWAPVKGLRLCIWPDADIPGYKAALAVADAAEKARAESVKIVVPPADAPEGFDLADAEDRNWGHGKVLHHLKASITVEEFCKLKGHLPEQSNGGDIGATLQINIKQPGNSQFDLSRLLTGADIAAGDYEVSFLVDRLIPESSITLFYAKGGSGKSTLATQIAAAVKIGISFMGLATLQRPVVVVDYENPIAVLKKRIQAVEGADQIQYWIGSDIPQLNTAEWVELKSLVMTVTNPLVIIDTLSSSCSSLDIANNKDLAPVMAKIIELRNLGATIVLLHHTPKSDETKYIGASCIYNQCDHILAMYPVRQAGSDQEATDDDEQKVYRLGTKDKSRFAHVHLYVEFDDCSGTFTKAADPAQEFIDTLTRFIMEQPGITQTEILSKIGPKNKIRALLKNHDGSAWRSEKGAKNATHYFPNPVCQFAAPLRSGKLENRNQLTEATGETELDNIQQSPIDTEFACYSIASGQTEKLGDLPDFDLEVLQ